MTAQNAVDPHAMQALARRLSPLAERIDGLRRLSGGASQEIWRFDLIEPGARTPLILRRAPGGGIAQAVAHGGADLATEARLIQAASAAGVPAPPIRAVLHPDDGLGEGFVMDFIEGETLGGRIVKSAALAEARRDLAYRCGEILARIHAIDPRAFPMLQCASPAALLDQWRAAYRASETRRPVFDLAFARLASRTPPPPARPRLVHGDFRIGNLIIGPDGVRAVLDWELAHVGDPGEDLGWICVNSWRFGMIGKPVGGIGMREELWAGYEDAGGAPVDRAASHWWEIFGTLRWGVICAGASTAFRTADPTVERAMIARRTSETEIDLLALLEADHAG